MPNILAREDGEIPTVGISLPSTTNMEVKRGLRVVRGPDWEGGNEDGGEGYVGTVVAGARADGGAEEGKHDVATVQWDVGGERHVYRCGAEGKYDLRVIDSAPAGVVHRHMECSVCGSESIAGCVWRCVHCLRYYLCTPCYMKDRHSVWHHFMRIDSPEKPGQRTRVRCRYQSGRVAARGVFVGARVVRGGDWRWSDQDGGAGREGSVVEIGGWQSESSRSVAVVEWRESGVKNKYRLGHKGKVDLQCRVAAEGGHCYLDHLPLLGSDYQPPTTQFICAGDRAQLSTNLNFVKSVQDELHDWDDRLVTFLGKVGLVNHIDFQEKETHVIFNAPTSCRISPKALKKVEGPDILPDDVVRVIDDMLEVHRLQKAGAGWNDDMALCLGQLGHVVRFMCDSPGVAVRVNGMKWVLDPLCLAPAPGEQPEDEMAEMEPENSINVLMAGMLQTEPSPHIMFAAVSDGDAKIVSEVLRRWPHTLSMRDEEDKTLLHFAAAKGRVGIVRVLLEHNADITATTIRTHESPLHTATHFNNYEVVKVLLDGGADVYVLDHLGRTPIHVATAWGYPRVLALLLSHSKQHLINHQDGFGNTALYVSSQAHRPDITRVLLDYGADMCIVGDNYVNSFVFAIIRKFLFGTELYLQYNPEVINQIKANTNFTPLHVTAQLDIYDILCYLASMEMCELEVKTYESCTALGIASDAGNIRCVESLVGYGADVEAIDFNGRTPLYLVLVRKNMKPLSDWTQHLNEFHEYVSGADNSIQDVPVYITVACFLVSEGASLEAKSASGATPLDVCPTEYQSLLQLFARPERRGNYRGSLPRYPLGLRRFPTKKNKPPETGTMSETTSTKSEATPTKSETTSTKSEATPTKSEATPTKSEATPTKSEATTPTKSEATTHTKSEATPTKSEATPTMSEATPPEVSVSGGDSNKTEESEVDSVTGPSCLLCEGPCDITFQPCGHTAMCAVCAQPVKRCPICKTAIMKRIKIT